MSDYQTWIEVDLDALGRNLNAMKAVLPNGIGTSNS